jgi:hypothetical protein
VALNLAVVIGLIGIWKWRKWGVYLFFVADVVLLAESLRTSLLAPPAYRLTVPGLVVVVIGAVILLVVFACAVGREWRHFQSAPEPGLSRATPLATPFMTAAAPRTNQVTVHLSEDPKTDFAKLAFKGEIFRFLTAERTKNYERQSGAWWSREDLKLVVVKKYSADFAADVLFREAEAAIDELAKQGEIVGTPTGYRAK